MTKVSGVRKPNLHLYLPWLRNQPKQKEFVLNCDSTDWKLPEYNGLTDRHLTYFFSSNKIRANLVKTGVIDPNGNVALDKGKNSQLSFAKKVPMKTKLSPIAIEKDTSVERIVAPYRIKKNPQSLPKFSKHFSTPDKKVSNLNDTVTPPKKAQPMSVKSKSGKAVRKVQPLSKEQLEQVFAKYQIKVVPSNTNFSTDASIAADDRSTDNEKKSEATPNKSNILIAEAKIEPDDEVFNFNLQEAGEEKAEQIQSETKAEAGVEIQASNEVVHQVDVESTECVVKPEAEVVEEPAEVQANEVPAETEVNAEDEVAEVEVEEKQTEQVIVESQAVEEPAAEIENKGDVSDEEEEYSLLEETC